MKTLSTRLWQQLHQTKRFEFKAQSQAGSKMDWHVHAFGATTLHITEHCLDYHDQFRAQNRDFSDKKRWVWHNNRLQFWHERAGAYQRVFEFDQALCAEHHCSPDVYRGSLQLLDNAVLLTIEIVGQRKNECLTYRYFP